MSVFTKSDLEGLKVFVEKPNWKATLNFIQKNVFYNNFFFFFDLERGANLNIFTEKITQDDISKIEKYLISLPDSGLKQAEDSIFSNFKNKSVIKIHAISQNSDIEIPKDMETAIYFEKQLSNILIGALNYNDFFVEEKNRINIALQLVFLAMVKIDKEKLFVFLPKSLNPKISKNIDPNLVAFYEEIQDIESEENIEQWVLDWLELTKTIETLAEMDFIIQSICQVLEIRTFATNVFETLIGILLIVKNKSNL
jgi:hypothetical protein